MVLCLTIDTEGTDCDAFAHSRPLVPGWHKYLHGTDFRVQRRMDRIKDTKEKNGCGLPVDVVHASSCAHIGKDQSLKTRVVEKVLELFILLLFRCQFVKVD